MNILIRKMTKKFAIQNKYKIFDDFLLQEDKTCINIDVFNI